MMGLSDGRKSFRIGLVVLIQYRSVTDTQPATQPASQPRCRSYYAQRSGVEPKNCKFLLVNLKLISHITVANHLRSVDVLVFVVNFADFVHQPSIKVESGRLSLLSLERHLF